MNTLYGPNASGGGFLAQRKKYIEAGLENENFYGWGVEDGERVNRWKILEYKYRRIEGVMFHLSHERGSNSKFHSDAQKKVKLFELVKIGTLTKNELSKVIANWPWVIEAKKQIKENSGIE